LIKSLPYIFFEKYINILALEMASPGNRHSTHLRSLLFAQKKLRFTVSVIMVNKVSVIAMGICSRGLNATDFNDAIFIYYVLNADSGR